VSARIIHNQFDSRGSALVEATLVHMLLLMFLFSIFNFAYVLFEHQTLMHQARTAARYGAINPTNLTAVQSMVIYGQPAAPDGSPAGIFGLEPSMVSVTRPDQGTSEDRIVIVVSGYKYTLIIPGMAGVFTGRPIQVSMPVETQ
jgi:TadE-like protein